MIDDCVYLAADDRVHSNAYCVSSVPEPSTIALFVMGIVGLLVTRFRKRK
ncbi:MAG: PEP-CTERM sorting domain-containing protein [Planctomycetia bacterium]